MLITDQLFMEHEAQTFSRRTKRFARKFNSFPAHKKVLFILVLVLVLPLSVYLFKTFTLFLSRAASAQLSFSPSTISMPPSANLGVVVNSGSAQIAFARVDISFDSSKVNLSDEIQITGPLKAVIGKTSRATANSTGKVTVVVALCNAIDIPCSPAPAAPTGTFELFKLPLASNTSQSTSASISYDVSTSQLVDSAQSNVTLTGSSATINLNPSGATPTAPSGNTVTPQPTNSNAQAATTLALTASKTTVGVNQNLPVNVSINTGANQVIGADLDITFDKTKLQVVDIQAGSFFTNPDVSGKIIDNNTGHAKLTVNTPPSTNAKSGTGTIAVVTVRGAALGTTRLDFGTGNLIAALNMDGLTALKSVTGLGLTVSAGLLGDINVDGIVDIVDYTILFANFGKTVGGAGVDARADINNDTKINILDYTYVFENFGKTLGSSTPTPTTAQNTLTPTSTTGSSVHPPVGQAPTSEQVIQFSAMPTNVQNVINQAHPVKSIIEVKRETYSNGAVVYAVEMLINGNQWDMEVLPDGTVIRNEEEVTP